jgi:uncharacterized protein (TIGR02145 family)
MYKLWFFVIVYFSLISSALYSQNKESSSTIRDADGNIYNTVIIGKQVWMRENLKTTKYNDDTAIPNVTEDKQWENLTTGAYSWYNNDITNKKLYGALYNWYAVETGKLCPTGWHVASDEDWTTLHEYLGGYEIAGEKLRNDDEIGFAAIGGGYRDGYNGSFNILDINFWWTSTELRGKPWMRVIFTNQTSIKRNNVFIKETGYYVRCIKD